MMDVKLRKINQNDTEKIRNWRNSDLIKNVSYNREEISKEQQQRWFLSISGNENRVDWIIVAENEDVGYASISNINKTHKRCEFANLYIGSEKHLLMGIGALAEFKIIEYTFNELPGIDKIYCEVLGFNEKVIKLHKRFGFLIEGQLKNHYIFDGFACDVVQMALFRETWRIKKDILKKIIK